MYVRLAFAVAAHLEPEILVVDEVLAVGDQAFQKKCLGRMSEVGRSGRTVLFVSHNLATVLNLCQKAVVLDQGQLAFVGGSEEGVRFYTNRLAECRASGDDLWNSPHRLPGRKPILKSAMLLNSEGEPTSQVLCGETVSIQLVADLGWASSGLHYVVGIDDQYGTRLMTASTHHTRDAEKGLVAESGQVVCRLTELPLLPGRYSITLYAGPVYAWGTDIVEPRCGSMSSRPISMATGGCPEPNGAAYSYDHTGILNGIRGKSEMIKQFVRSVIPESLWLRLSGMRAQAEQLVPKQA